MTALKKLEGYLYLIFKGLSSLPFCSWFYLSFLLSIPCFLLFPIDFLAFQNIRFLPLPISLLHSYNSLFHFYSGIILFFFFIFPFLSPLLFIPSVFFIFPLCLVCLLHTAMVPPEASSLNDGGLVIFGTSMNATSIKPWHLYETPNFMEKRG